MLANVLFIIASVFSQYIHAKSFGCLSNKKFKWNARILILFIIIATILTVLNQYFITIFSVILSMVYFPILYKTLYKCPWRATLICATIIWIISMMLDFFTMLGMTIINFPELIKTIDPNYFKAGATIVSQVFLILILSRKAVLKIVDKIKTLNNFYLKTVIVISLMLICGTICSLNLDKISYNVIAVVIITLVLVMFIFYLLNEYNVYTLKQTNYFLLKNNEFYISIVNDYKMLKHNIIHQLNGVKSVANEEAKELIDDIIREYNKNFKSTQDIQKMPVGINGIVYEKIYNFSNQDLNLNIENRIETPVFDNLTPRSYNLLCEALGILLDNALEASDKSKEQIIMIDMNETESNYCIKIINTFIDNLDIEKLGNMNYSTKNNGHGIGLFSIIGKRKLKVKTSIINNLFQNEILIEKNKNKKIIEP